MAVLSMIPNVQITYSRYPTPPSRRRTDSTSIGFQDYISATLNFIRMKQKNKLENPHKTFFSNLALHGPINNLSKRIFPLEFPAAALLGTKVMDKASWLRGSWSRELGGP